MRGGLYGPPLRLFEFNNAKILVMVLFGAPTLASLPGIGSAGDVKAVFRGYTTAFEITNERTGESLRVGGALLEQRVNPCSTYKIMNSMIGLETGVIGDENFVIKWDGTKYPSFPDWEHDQTLVSAYHFSCVWYYQELARRVGPERMQHWLNTVGYGNRDISGGQTVFWLGGRSLKVSPDEQMAMLRKLELGTLPFTSRTQEIVRKISVWEKGTGWVLHAKTGTAGSGLKGGLGWYVGWIDRGPDVYTFAINIRGGKNPIGPEVRKIVHPLFARWGLTPGIKAE